MNYRRLREQQAAEAQEKRRELFSAQGHANLRERSHLKHNDALRNQAMKTTESLSLLVSKMGEQVQRSENTTTNLIHSSEVLKTTHGQYNTIKYTINIGNKLISKYGRREFTDRILLGLALCVYFGVVLYILHKRLPLVGYFI
uniref:Golgi SNAP receptor complex member 2 n=1 Tax=Panagrellus redivivus TaxID=6233 RepID=A0A7E4UVE8_PANRE